ncbi:MAG: hypothetical protein IKH42_01250 [Lachnospiraceae bacterium]|nr:hypothetical protein [Lachnospiraceae bacterium]
MSETDQKNKKNVPGNKQEGTVKRSVFLQIFAIFGIVLILGLYILSLIASLSNWENSFGIFVGALAATVFVPIMIHLIKIFLPKE